MAWIAFIAGLLGLCFAAALALAAARQTSSAHALQQPRGLADGYPDVGGVGSPLMAVGSVGTAIVSVVLMAYGVRALDSSATPATLLAPGALSGDSHALNAPTGPLKLPRRASIAQVSRE